jgi:hypothetical protein
MNIDLVQAPQQSHKRVVVLCQGAISLVPKRPKMIVGFSPWVMFPLSAAIAFACIVLRPNMRPDTG